MNAGSTSADPLGAGAALMASAVRTEVKGMEAATEDVVLLRAVMETTAGVGQDLLAEVATAEGMAALMTNDRARSAG